MHIPVGSNSKSPQPRWEGLGRRKTGRRLQESLVSNLGPVLDISAGGMRVLASRRPGGLHQIVLEGRTGKTELQGEVIWTRRLGFRRHEVGIRFHAVDAALAQLLTDIASTHSRSQYWLAA